jgi:hypothetical protein
MDKVMWAYQARQVRTWYWSSPASICHLLPAIHARPAVLDRRGP